MRNIRFYITIIVLLTTQMVSAQQYRPLNSVQIFEQLKQLQHLTNVMYLAAHPDDENTRLLSYLTHERNYNTIYLSLTRGDGGQNLIGTELGTGLGLIRNYELIAARQLDGAKQAFTSFVDFGFSKTPEETFKFWDKQILTDEVIKAIQKYRPDVIICRFPTDGRGGHGQHTASAIVGLEAFKALEKAKYPHRPQRILFNAFKFGDRNTTNESQFKVITNQYNPLLGESYGEMAGRSRSIHRSQGAGTPQSIGMQYEYFELMGGTPIDKDLIDLDISWNRVGAPHIDKQLKKIISLYDFTNPHRSLKAIMALRNEIMKVKEAYWRTTKLNDLDQIILSLIGFTAEVTTTHPAAIPGDTIPVQANIIARHAKIEIRNLSIPGYISNNIKTPIALLHDTTLSLKGQIVISPSLPITQPYWLQEAPMGARYQYDSMYFSLPENPLSFSANVQVAVEGVLLEVKVPISYKYLHPVKGDVVQALRIEPELLVKPKVEKLYYDLKEEKVKVDILISNNSTLKNGQLQLHADGRSILEVNIGLPARGKDSIYMIEIPLSQMKHTVTSTIQFTVKAGGKEYQKYQHKIAYDHLPELVYYDKANIQLIAKVWKPMDYKIGYINGAGDKVMQSLKDMGLDVSLIPDAMLQNIQYLSQFDAIVIGVRAYNTNEALGRSKDILMQYMERGGNLIVQYNTHQPLVSTDFAPYPLVIGRDRVTDETATVRITNASSPLLQKPNTITADDFKGWVQEFGLYYPSTIDAKYTTIMSMNDPGEAPLNNALIYAPYGKGYYIYTGLSFFRQLPAGNIGAIKLFMNMLALGKVK